MKFVFSRENRKSLFDHRGSFIILFFVFLFLQITDVLFLVGIKEEVADGSNQGIDPHGKEAKEEIQTGSGSKTIRPQRRVVDDQAANPTQQEGQQKTNYIFIVHW